ncbi:MAG: sigma-54-dependent Fis family transcriptional regulator [Sedimentisphaerales bacterium]|nr:sigma-54-dependent Fis family transcriptional regulator [Sedimentisphaerales bacterium]
MKANKILVVDDEKNIRMTINQALADMDLETDTAVNGEEALAKLKDTDFGLMLLDLRMPGMDGMEVLAKLRNDRPDIRVVIITAHGTIDSAIDAMKLGAVDFIQKPFTPGEIRHLVSKIIKRETLDKEKSQDYETCLELAKKCVADRHFEAAAEHVKKAISIDSSRAEAFNFLGALSEVQGDKIEGQKNYRAALSLDPTYKPAQDNLSRSTRAKPDADTKIKFDDKTSN